MWVASLALTALSLGAVGLQVIYFSLDAARLPIAPEPHWGWWLRHQWYEPMGYAALIAPVLAAGALVARRWRIPALGILAVTALFQVAALVLEYQWKQQERAGAFDRPNLLEQSE